MTTFAMNREMLRQDNIPMASLIERRVNIEDTVEAYEYFDKQTSGKMVITFD